MSGCARCGESIFAGGGPFRYCASCGYPKIFARDRARSRDSMDERCSDCKHPAAWHVNRPDGSPQGCNVAGCRCSRGAFGVRSTEPDAGEVAARRASVGEGRRSPTEIRTSSGAYFDAAEPETWKLDVGAIASGLAKTCRYGGQVPRFYSVAEHSVLVAAIASEAGAGRQGCLAALLHDAHEAFYGDLPTPVKSLVPELSALMDRFDRSLERQMGWRPGSLGSETVRAADSEAFRIEWKPVWAGKDDGGERFRLRFLAPEEAEKEFLLMVDLLAAEEEGKRWRLAR